MAPGLLSTFVVVFAFVFGFFEIPYLVGRSYPSTLPVMAYRKYIDFDLNARPEAMAIAVMMLVFTLVMTGVYMAISRRYIRRH